MADYVGDVFPPPSNMILQSPCRLQAEITYNVLRPCWYHSPPWPAVNFQPVLAVSQYSTGIESRHGC